MYGHKYGSVSSGVTGAIRREQRAAQFRQEDRPGMQMTVTTYDGLVLSGRATYGNMPVSDSQVRGIITRIRFEYEDSGKQNTAPLYNTLAIAGVNVYIGSIEKVERG